MTARKLTARKLSAPQTSPRVWQRMLSGRRLDLLDPSPLDIEIADIAHGLGRVARWNGQTHGPHIFSVAQHTLLVEAVMREHAPGADHRLRLVVVVRGGSSKVWESRPLAAIHIRFGLPPALPAAMTQQIKAADVGAAYLEAT